MLQLLSQTDYRRHEIKTTLAPALRETPLFQEGPAAAPSVLLKPNFVMPAPRDDASTTHPEFYMAVAELLLERGFQVGIGESPAIGSCEQALRAHGVLEECRTRGIRVVEFRRPRHYAGAADGQSYQTLSIAEELQEWDAVVNLPKIKTHQQFTFTAATKNLYGCVTGKRKFVRHNLCANDPVRFARMLLANAQAAGCVLHISDGIHALHVKGPRGGKPYPLGRIIVAEDYLEHDWLCCRLIDLAPERTPLFQALDTDHRERLEHACSGISEAPSFEAAADFVHAPLMHISFSPWAIVRSSYRRLRHALGAATGRADNAGAHGSSSAPDQT